MKEQLSVIKDSFGRVVWTHKTHEKQAEIYKTYCLIFNWLTIILTALTTGSLINVLLNDDQGVKTSAILSALSLGSLIAELIFDFSGKRNSHKSVAKELWGVKEKYINLIADIKSNGLDEPEIIRRRDSLTEHLTNIYNNAPPTSNDAYKKASKALNVDNEHSFEENEVDQFLPVDLRDLD